MAELKGSDGFQAVILKYLQDRAESDTLFAETMKKEKKNIKDCITYILNTVKASGQAGFDDEEIFNMAVHYYDEDDIDVGKPMSATVKVNHHVAAPAPKPAAATPSPAPVKKKKTIVTNSNQSSLF